MKANETPDLFTDAARHPSFGGVTYDAGMDGTRLTTALEKVIALMRDGRERTLAEVASYSGCTEAGASARLRDLRKPKMQARFGSFTVTSRRADRGLWLYRITPTLP